MALILSALVTTLLWSKIAVWTASPQVSSTQTSKLSRQANNLFWDVLHSGAYERIPELLPPLQAALSRNPDDAVTASHLGWVHIWKLSEAARLEALPADMPSQAILSRHYFAEAVAREPADPRLQGFLADLEMTVASLTNNEGLQRQGYFRGLKAIKAWPEFNGFTIGYLLTANNPHDSDIFAEGLQMMWDNTFLCLGSKVPKHELDLNQFFSQPTQEKPQAWQRACINSWIAPYNVEGFMLTLADAVVKSGDAALGHHLYQEITKSPTFASWPYQHVLNDRIKNVAENIAKFRQPPRAVSEDWQGQVMVNRENDMMFHSEFSCMGCHQHSALSCQRYQMPSFVEKTLK